MKKILAIVLLLSLCLSFAACSKSDAPKDMISAHMEGEPFKLYVPEGWTPHIMGGISGAYFAPSDKIIVTARYHTPSDSNITLDDYVTYCADSYLASLDDFNLTGRYPDVLGGEDARKLTYTMSKDGESYSVIQYVARYKSDMISLTFYGTGKALETYADGVEKVTSNFVLCEKTQDLGDCVTDKNTPEGMKIASADKLEYRFYVPTSWICSSESPSSEAYYPESEKTNVTVSSFSPDGETTLEQFAQMTRDGNEKALLGYEMIESTSVTVTARAAVCDTFKVSYDGQDIRIRQVMLYSAQTGLFYVLTYTATAEKFDEHIADFDAMLAAFCFR